MKRFVKLITRQYSIMPSWVGGLIIVHQELLSMIGFFTFAGVMNTVWLNYPDWHRFFFDSFLFFLFCFIPLFEFMALLYYKFMVHSRQTYQQHQSFTPGRSPLYDDFKRFEERTDKNFEKLNKRLADIEAKKGAKNGN